MGKYISIESEIERTKKTYYEALHASSVGWTEGKSDYVPFVSYLLGVISSCYKELSNRIVLAADDQSNEARVRHYFAMQVGPVSKREVVESNPYVSQRTIERILLKMQADDTLKKIGAARSTRYVLKM